MSKTDHLHIGRIVGGASVEVPADIQTLTTAVLGIRGSGKSHTASVVVEGLLELDRQVVVIDPTDVWWGLRSSPDGKTAGYPIVLLGGPRGDVPLAEADGATIADFVVEHRLSAILSLRHLRKAGQRRLVCDFAEQLYHRKGEAQHRSPLLVAIDECDAFVPQRVGGAEARMVGAIEDLVRRGRSVGLGVMLISQRAASINKDVLTQAELLVAHRHVSPQDRKALEAWVEAHDVEGRRDEFMRSVANLPRGTAWFWSPGWLDVFAKVQVRPRRTFDSSATPTVGKTATPDKRAEVDLDDLKAKLSKTVEEARSNDPKELRRRIAQLEAQLSKQKPVVDEAAIERAVRRARLEMHRALQPILQSLERSASSLKQDAAGMQQSLASLRALMKLETEPAPATRPNPIAAQPAKSRPAATAKSTSISAPDWFRPAHQRILNALAWLRSVGLETADRSLVAAVAGVSPRSSSFRNDVSRLSSSGLIIYPTNGELQLTANAEGLYSEPEAPPTLADLHDAWRNCPALRPAHIRLLNALIECYPSSMSREALAQAAGVSVNSSSFRNDVSRLSSIGLAEYPERGSVRASERLLFPPEIGGR